MPLREVFLLRSSVKPYFYRAVNEHGQMVVGVLLRERRDLANSGRGGAARARNRSRADGDRPCKSA